MKFSRRIVLYFAPIIRISPIYRKWLKKYCFVNTGPKFKHNIISKIIGKIFSIEYWERDIGARADIQNELMGGDIGSTWADSYNKAISDFPPQRNKIKIGGLDWYEAQPFLDKIDTILSSMDEPCTVIQIGASSGREIAYFAKKHPEHNFIYTDLFDSVVDFAKEHYNFLPNLSFLCCSGENTPLIASTVLDQEVIIFSSGSCQYMYPEHVDVMFNHLSKYAKQKHIQVIVQEPGNEIYSDPITSKGSVPRANFSYTHNYSYYAIKYGFDQIEYRKITPYLPHENYPHHKGTVHIYGHYSKFLS